MLPPPAGFGKFKTWADVDRLPSLYLGDLAAEQPRYLHPRYGAIETFGWCSEREMAFGVLLAAQGVRAKIKQKDIHVWSEALLELRGKDGKARPTVIAFDNTFATVEAWPLAGSRQAWAGDFGSGADVRWYNRVSHSAEQAARVKAIRVGPGAAKRMAAKIEAWLSPAPGGPPG